MQLFLQYTKTKQKHMYFSECNSFDAAKFPGVADLSPQLPVATGTVLTVSCERPRSALITGDSTLTCQHG